MKKLIVILFLLVCTQGFAQQGRVFTYPDSLLTTSRQSIRIDCKRFLYQSVVIDSIGTGDTLQFCVSNDSIAPKHNRDTVKAYVRNLSTYTETASGQLTGLNTQLTLGGIEIAILNPNIEWIYIKLIQTGTVLTHKVYLRPKGVNY